MARLSAHPRIEVEPHDRTRPVTSANRRLDLLATADGIDAATSDAIRVVLDSAWTPDASTPVDVVPIRAAFNAVVEGHALSAEALGLVDAWARDVGAADRLVVDGVSYWFRMREPMWYWVHERLLWRATLSILERGEAAGQVRVPADEAALVDVLHALGRDVEETGAAAAAPAGRSPAASRGGRPAGTPLGRLLRRIERRLAGSPGPPARGAPADPESSRRAAILRDRIDGLLAGTGPRAIVLTLPASYQRFGGAHDGVRRDPNLGSVIPALRAAGFDPVVVGCHAKASDPGVWSLVESDERLVPVDAVRRRWTRPEDADRAGAAAAAIGAAIDTLGATPIRIEDADIGPAFVAALRDQVTRIVVAETRELAVLERAMDDLRPSALVTTQEHHRTPWLVAARRAGVPTFGLQHGVLYATHPGYPGRRHPSLVLPDLTFVFGEYERQVLLGMGYRDDEVAVSGSPRLDLDRPAAVIGDRADERTAVRTELGVRDGDRMLVVSGVPTSYIRRAHFVHMLDRILGGPLPGVHLVFKQHPGERDGGPYRELLDGLARAGAYDPPTISVVRDIDLYRLLRAADAHLGLSSTVLTDAVMAGTPNLIADVEPKTDTLDWGGRGVATRVTGPADLLAALADPRPASPEARAAFLGEHFREGLAGIRIAEVVRERAGLAAPSAPASPVPA